MEELETLIILLGMAITIFAIAGAQVLHYSSKVDEYFIKAIQEKDSGSRVTKLDRSKEFKNTYHQAIFGITLAGSSVLVLGVDTVIQAQAGWLGGLTLMGAALVMIFLTYIFAPKWGDFPSTLPSEE